jgi:predicted membrane channel-forming protein YqfA (hemolysin III family)
MKPFIGSVSDAAPWMIREHIYQGYRIGFDSHYKVMRSLFMWHNETSNTWTHLIGAIVFVWFMVYVALYMSLPSIPAFPNDWCPSINTTSINTYLSSHQVLHPEANSLHSFYNHHGEAFERVELMLKQSLAKLKSG